MEKMKYVVLETAGMETIILFPAHIQHSQLRNLGKVVSAGFVGHSSRTRSGFYCYGESISLDLKSRPQDQMLLDLMMKKGE